MYGLISLEVLVFDLTLMTPTPTMTPESDVFVASAS